MSSAAAVSLARRPARWPWFVVAGFIACAIGACFLVVANGGSIIEQVPFIIAFGLFGIVGALILSRERGNRIGGLLLYGSGITAVSFVAGEATIYLADQGVTDGWFAALTGLLSEVGWIVGIIPVLVLLPLLFPDGHLPSRRWWPLVALSGVLIGFLFVASVFATPRFAGNGEVPRVDNPLYIGALDRFEIPDPVLRGIVGPAAC